MDGPTALDEQATSLRRGVFAPARTSVVGMHMTEGLARVARQAQHLALVRSVHHTIRCHNPAIYCTLVGREATDPKLTWTVGGDATSNVVGHVIVVHDATTPSKRIACGKITMP